MATDSNTLVTVTVEKDERTYDVVRTIRQKAPKPGDSWAMYEPVGPVRYVVNGKEVTKEEAEAWLNGES